MLSIDNRMKRLAEGRKSLLEYKTRLIQAITEKESEIKFLCEDYKKILAPRQKMLEGTLGEMEQKLKSIENDIAQTSFFKKLMPSFRKKALAVEKFAIRTQAYKDNFASSMQEALSKARIEASDNASWNNKKRKVLGSLPSLLEQTNTALEAIMAGDAAVATCIIRGQTERALRVASIWKARKENRTIIGADTDFYMTAFYEKDTHYEHDDMIAYQEEEIRKQQKLLDNALQTVRMNEIMKILSQKSGSGSIVDADWEDITNKTSKNEYYSTKVLLPYKTHDSQP